MCVRVQTHCVDHWPKTSNNYQNYWLVASLMRQVVWNRLLYEPSSAVTRLEVCVLATQLLVGYVLQVKTRPEQRTDSISSRQCIFLSWLQCVFFCMLFIFENAFLWVRVLFLRTYGAAHYISIRNRFWDFTILHFFHFSFNSFSKNACTSTQIFQPFLLLKLWR